jgi:hypothetical protein
MAPLLYRLKDHVGVNCPGYNRAKEYEEKRQSDEAQL